MYFKEDRFHQRLFHLKRRLLRYYLKVRCRKSLWNHDVGGMELPPLNRIGDGSCKICKSEADDVGTVDFNKCCEEAMGIKLPTSGLGVTYKRCRSCSFLFTQDFDDWDEDKFHQYIYNDLYKYVDPDYKSIRPIMNAVRVRSIVSSQSEISILDYGGGNGLLSKRLRGYGFDNVKTYDPFNPKFSARHYEKFDFVTCFEVLEHVPNPTTVLTDLCDLIKDDGAIFFSTTLQSAESDAEGLNWWYIAPRNGHISLFSRASLDYSFSEPGLKWGSVNGYEHLAWRGNPKFLSGSLQDICGGS